MPVQTAVRWIVSPRLQWRRAASVTRTAASYAFELQTVAVEVLWRRPSSTLGPRLGSGEGPDEAYNARTKLVQDAQVVVAVVPVADA